MRTLNFLSNFIDPSKWKDQLCHFPHLIESFTINRNWPSLTMPGSIEVVNTIQNEHVPEIVKGKVTLTGLRYFKKIYCFMQLFLFFSPLPHLLVSSFAPCMMKTIIKCISNSHSKRLILEEFCFYLNSYTCFLICLNYLKLLNISKEIILLCFS